MDATRVPRSPAPPLPPTGGDRGQPGAPGGTELGERLGGKVMKRLDLTRRLSVKLTHGEIIVGGIGNANFDLAEASRRPEDFYMLGSMGLAVPIGLGLALAQPKRRVFVLEGDGSMLMSMGCLATVAMVAPVNLTVIVWDNGLYQITGNQPAATAETVDLVAVARGSGFPHCAWARDEDAFEQLIDQALRENGPRFIGARVDRAPGAGRPERDPVLVKDRLMRALGLKPNR